MRNTALSRFARYRSFFAGRSPAVDGRPLSSGCFIAVLYRVVPAA